MIVCHCSLAGTAACRTCTNNPYAETPPPVRTYTTWATDKVLITGAQTNADRIRAMSDEELATMLYEQGCFAPNCDHYDVCYASCRECWLAWLKEEVSE